MIEKFRFRLYTAHQFSDRKVAQRVWRLLDDPIVAPGTFDRVEKTKQPFDLRDFGAARALYEEHGALFVRGKRDGFLAEFSRRPKFWSTWTFWLNTSAMEGDKAEKWLEWVFSICNAFPVLYGLGASEAEYKAKHISVSGVPGEGAMTRTVGVSIQDFYKYLPGFYWLSIFGPEVVATLGERNVRALPNAIVTSLADGQLAIRLSEDAMPSDMQHRLARERELADLLGPQFFFDMTREAARFEPIPELATRLEKLKKS